MKFDPVGLWDIINSIGSAIAGAIAAILILLKKKKQ
jgi:hypothetical protein